jgi:lipopolysaccharide transport system ATP-binding protein
VLCNRGMFLRGGRLVYTGSTKEAIDLYIAGFSKANGQDDNPDRRTGSGEYRYTSASPGRQIYEGAEEKVVNFELVRRGKRMGSMWVCARIVDSTGVVVAQCDSRLLGFMVEDLPRISGHFRFTTPWLRPGSYRVDLSVGVPSFGDPWTLDYWEGACSLMISPVLPYPNSAPPDASAQGFVFADFSWEASEARQESAASIVLQDGGNGKMPQIEHSTLER